MHQPHADLVMIVSVRDNIRAVETAREIFWLLGRFGGLRFSGGLEVLGRREQRPHLGGRVVATAAVAPAALGAPAADPAARRQHEVDTAREQEERLIRGVQETAPKRGVVLSLPRRALQGWLLREGRARNAAGGGGGDGGGGGLWTPSWVEDGIDVVPPDLPGLHAAAGEDDEGIVGGSRDDPADAGRRMSALSLSSSSQEAL